MTNVIKDGDYTSLIQHQQLQDAALWQFTMDERLHYCPVWKKKAALIKTKATGTILFNTAVNKLFGGKKNVTWDQSFFEQCILETEQNKLKVSKNLLENQEERASPSWEDNYTKTFIKSQWVKKKKM